MRHHSPKPAQPRRNKLTPTLTTWLNHTIYPHLTHVQIFGQLPGYTDRDGDFYADCPVCHRPGVFYGLKGRHVGQCKSCMRIIGWFGFVRFRYDGDEDRAIASLAELAGVTIGPDGQPLGLETLGDGDILGLFTLPLSLDDSPP